MIARIKSLTNQVGFLVVSLSAIACEPDVPEDPIPYALVNEQINLNSLLFEDLKIIGGSVELENVGVKGIIVYRVGRDDYRAFDRACSFRPSHACERVMVDESGLFMVDTCCSSTFDFFGFPNSGPARWPLAEYRALVSGDNLLIRNR